VDKLKDDFEILKLINKYDITYNEGTKSVKINKKIKVQDLRIIRSLLIMNQVDYEDIIVEV
jgi:hypothetical protein